MSHHRPSTFAIALLVAAGSCPAIAGALPRLAPPSASDVIPARDAYYPYRTFHHQRRYGSGYVVNRQGFGNYVRGPNGSFGGYPAGSDGAQELQMNQRYKCQAVPESC